MPSSRLSLWQYFLKLLAKRDYSEQELVHKAHKLGYAQDLIDATIDQLKAHNYLNEERLATNLIAYYGQQKGRRWLVKKLQSRLIKPALIDAILSQYQEPIPLTLKTKLAVKYGITDWCDIPPKIKHKILTYLLRQGYSSADDILQAWQAAENP